MFNMKSKLYDMLKWMAQYFFPAMGTLYFALSGIWGLPYGEQIVGTITAIDIFLGIILGISSAQYNKTKDGSFLIDTSDPKKDIYKLVLDTDLSDLSDKTTLTLNIQNGANLK